MNAIVDAAAEVLTAHPDGLTVPRLVRAVKASAGAGVSRSAVERVLARDGRFRRTDVLGRARSRQPVGEEPGDRQPGLAHEVADATARGQSADSDRARVAKAGRELVRRGRLRVLDRGQP